MKSKLLVALAMLAAGCGAKSASPTAPAPTTSSLQVVAEQKLMEVGGEQRLSAHAVMSDGSTSALTSGLTWKSSDRTILDVTSDGVVTAVSAGEATVSLSWNGFTGTTLLRNQQTRSGVFVHGRVREFQTGNLLAGASVQFEGLPAVSTNAEGAYSIWLNAPGHSTVRVSSRYQQVIVTSARFDGDLSIDSANACVARYGHVLDDSTGEPIAGATVALVGRQTTSAADGSYRLEVSCATNTWGFNTTFITASQAGYSQRGIVVGRGVSNVERLDISLIRP